MKIRACLLTVAALLPGVWASGADESTKAAQPRPVVSFDIKHDVSPPMRLIKSAPPQSLPDREIPMGKLERKNGILPPALSEDPLLGVPEAPQAPMPAPLVSFEGTNDDDNQAVVGFRVVPPDTNGDVGPNHYVQFNNLVWEVFNKSGTSLLGPLAGNSPWAGFGGPCETNNDGDPIAIYDQLADRWILSQFSINQGIQCTAISTTPDPTGSYFRYAFAVTPGGQNDYPKLGVWPDAYYSTYRRFPGGTFRIVAAAFERAAMLTGGAARLVTFDIIPPSGLGCTGSGDCYDGILPAHLEGMTPPPAGAPGLFVSAFDDEFNQGSGGGTPDPSQDFYKIWKFHVDFATPANSTLTGPINVPSPEFDENLCGGSACVPQPAPGELLDHLSFFTMYRPAYRNLGGQESLVVNNTVNVGSSRAGIRWAEIRDPEGTATLFQAGTYAPADGVHRWMGSMAMDVNGNIALGFSASSSTLFPSIRYVGRLAGDPLGTLPQTEVDLIAGGGAQTGSFNRWGDYSAMSVDDTDGCTFWYTTEYYDATASFDFKTRIGAFKFPTCQMGNTGTLTGTVTNSSNSQPITGARVAAGTASTLTNASGVYTLILPGGTYDVDASAFGFASETAPGVVVTNGQTTTQDFSLDPLPNVTVDGFVTDGSGAGWPLYARVVITPTAGGPATTKFTDPDNGYYSATLVSNTAYTFTVTAQAPGYLPAVRAVTTGSTDSQESFGLQVDAGVCNAPGYSYDYAYFQDFEANDGGYTISGTTTFEWGVPTSGPGHAASGTKAWATNLEGNYNNNESGFLTSPLIDLSAFAGRAPVLFWSQWLKSEQNFDFASVEVSNNGGTTWTRVYGEVSGSVNLTWARRSVVLSPTYSVANFRVRFRFRTDSSVVDLGWYLDDVAIVEALPQTRTTVFNTDLEADNGGFAVSGTTSWAYGSPSASPGPGSAHSGTKVWATNLTGNYANSENGFITSGNIDLSAFTGRNVEVSWWHWLQSEGSFDFASVDASSNGGTSWTTVYGPVSGSIDLTYAQKTVSLAPSYAVSNFRMRFHFTSDSSVVMPGWYVDDFRVSSVDPLVLPCNFTGGGIIYGNVYDQNTGTALNGAMVSLDTGETAVTLATPDDPQRDDGFYMIHAPLQLTGAPGMRTITVTKPLYGTVTRDVVPRPNSTLREDFQLPAGRLAVTPDELRMRVAIGGSDSMDLQLDNTGTRDATFNLLEINAPASSTVSGGRKAVIDPVAPKAKTKEEEQASLATNARQAGPFRKLLQAPPVLLAGDYVFQFDTGLPGGWGNGYDTKAGDLWIGNLLALGGDDKDYRFLTNGTNTGDTITQPWVSVFAADMTYNARTGMLWQVNVGGDNCLYEMDPVAKTSTGNKICANFGTSMRGLAYNAVDDTYFVGTWNNGGFIMEIDKNGNILRNNNIGLGISGLAYNGSTGHVFAQVNDASQLVYVLDARANFAIRGAFSLSDQAGNPAYAAFEGAGIEMDCQGVLWSVNQVTQKVFANTSGETGACVTNIPWLSEEPTSGTVAVGATATSSLTFDAAGQAPGCQEAQLVILNDTPYGSLVRPAGITVEFGDVPAGSFGDAFIHGIAGARVTAGCGGGNFCPSDVMTRRVMAVWLLLAKFGSAYNPPPASGIFGDVSPESFGANFIEDLYNRGIVTGCSTNPPLYCPESPVTRAQMAVFLLATLEGPGYQPPPCQGMFGDMPCTNPFAKWVEELARRGITGGCSTTPPLYCPDSSTTRAQMAIFTSATFDIAACRQ